jgi:hypothetical protein
LQRGSVILILLVNLSQYATFAALNPPHMNVSLMLGQELMRRSDLAQKSGIMTGQPF